MRRACTLILLLTALAAFGAADADPPREPMWSVSAGKLGVFDDIGDPFELGIAYRFRPLGKWSLLPAVGATVHDNGAYFVYSELRREFWLGRSWLLVPSFGVGLFEDGKMLDLGHTVEFRSGLEVGRRLENGWRVGAALFHLSNGGIGDRNPGTEALVFSISIPLGRGDPVATPD